MPVSIGSLGKQACIYTRLHDGAIESKTILTCFQMLEKNHISYVNLLRKEG
jgi:hypothetical protein